MTTFALPTEFATMDLTRVPWATFREAFRAARAESDIIRAATSDPDYSDAETTGTYYWLTADRRTGFAIRYTGHEGELVYVFSLERGRGDFIVRAAVDRGASHLDCFDGYLPTLYARHGFVETRREANWTPGEPDVVFMARVA